MSALTRMMEFLKPYKRDIILAVVLLIMVVGLDLSIPRLLQVIIDEGIATKNIEVILNTSLIMVGASILSALLAIGNTVFSVRASQSFAADARESIYHKIQKFSFENLDKFQIGKLLVRLTSDVNQLQMMVLMTLRMFVRAPLLITGSIILMVSTNQQLTITMILLLPLILVLTVIFVRVAHPLFKEIQKRLDNLNQVLQENISGIRVVKAFVRKKHEIERFDEANIDLMKHTTKVSRLLSILFPLMMLIMNSSVIALVYFGGLESIAGNLTVGEIMAFINYFHFTMFPLLMLSIMAGQISAANASAERIVEILDTVPNVQDKPRAKTLQTIDGRVVFENVCFSYGEDCGEHVLRNINLVAEPGQTVAILGATGSGKTSLVQLVSRFYDVTEGSVTIDGLDVRDVTQESLRSHIGVCLQEVILFSGTIRDNIKYGKKDATDEEVIAAAKAAQAHDFIKDFTDGYETMVGQRGVTLSGGQKQRIAIARALLVNPRILILDDSTRFVDVETEAKIHYALEALMKDRTSFIIAQRVSTVLNADKIVVLNDGEIVAEGTHHELMETSPIYREIYESQLGNGGDYDE
jgi:ATP-binding cassette subfamily B multidrug efflux pump